MRSLGDSFSAAFGDSWGDEAAASQPANDGPWRKLSTEWPKPRRRRKLEQLVESAPAPIHAPAHLRENDAVLCISYTDAPAPEILTFRETLGAELARPLPGRRPRLDAHQVAEAELAIALLLAA